MKVTYVEIIKLNNEYLKIGDQLLFETNLTVPSNSDFIQASVFERLCEALQSMNALIKLMDKGLNLENSLGLIMRCACVDMMTVFYVTSLENPEEIYEETIRILYGSTPRDKRYLNDLVDQKIIPAEFKTSINEQFLKIEKEFREKFGHEIKELSTSEINKKLRQLKLGYTANLFDYFTFYSKYEHFSKKTYKLQRDPKVNRIAYTVEVIDRIFFCLKFISANGIYNSLNEKYYLVEALNNLKYLKEKNK